MKPIQGNCDGYRCWNHSKYYEFLYFVVKLPRLCSNCTYFLQLTLYKAASDPTYLKRGGGGICPDLSSRPVVPRETQWWFPPKLLVSMWSRKKELGWLAKNWARGPKLKFSTNSQSGRKLDFQEFLCSRTKIVIARWFLDQWTQFFLQMKAKTYVYVMEVPFWV